MLRGMRKASSNWLGKTIMAVVMGVLIISFGIWGIADIFRGFGQSTLAKVGHIEISLNQFRQLYTDRLQQISRQFGRPLTTEQARAFGLDRQVLQQTIAEAALDEDARRLGLGQSDAETMRLVFSDPNFQGVNGKFDPQRFQAMIRQFGFSEQRYIADQRRVSLRRQIAGSIAAGLEPPKTLIEALSRFQNEQRSIEYVKLDAAQAGTIDPPSPETLAGYFDDHKTQFRAPEYRKLSFVLITPEEIGKWCDVSDEDAKKLCEQRRDRLGKPEEREVSQIVFPNVEEAQAARSRIAGGLSFDDLAKERGLSSTDVTLGTVAKSAILDPEIANAAFSLPAGEVGQPVTSIPNGLDVVSQAFNSDVGVDNDPISFKGGYVWYDVLGITPSRERTLEEVKDQVEAKWRDDQISARLRTKATEMVQKLEQGGKLADEAASTGSKVEIAAGLKRDASPPGVPSGAIAAAFRTAKDGVGQTSGSGGSEWIVFRVTDIAVPPVDLSSDDIKKLKETLERAMTDEQVAQYVTRLEKDIGTSVNEAAFAQVTGANN